MSIEPAPVVAAWPRMVAPLPAPGREDGDTWLRFSELVRAGVDLFNRGSLSQAGLLLELAERWKNDHGLDAASVDLVRDRLGAALDSERIRKSAEKVEEQTALRAILRLFSAYTPDRLLEELRLEPPRERRRWLFSVLEACGEPARAIAASRLRQPFGEAADSTEWYFRRNLLHLLRRIPHEGDDPPGDAIELAIRHSRLGLPSFLVTEAIGLLGQLRDDRAEFALIHLLEELEDLVPERDFFGDTRNLAGIADRAATALTSFPTRRAHRAIVNYAERIQLELGPGMTILAGLGRQDLSSDEATVDRLIGLLRRSRLSDFASRLLTGRIDRDDQHMVPVIEALAGTPLPVVQRALEQIVQRYPARSSGRAAARALAELTRRKASVAGRS